MFYLHVRIFNYPYCCIWWVTTKPKRVWCTPEWRAALFVSQPLGLSRAFSAFSDFEEKTRNWFISFMEMHCWCQYFHERAIDIRSRQCVSSVLLFCAVDTSSGFLGQSRVLFSAGPACVRIKISQVAQSRLLLLFLMFLLRCLFEKYQYLWSNMISFMFVLSAKCLSWKWKTGHCQLVQW